jgi:hypothetical protein
MSRHGDSLPRHECPIRPPSRSALGLHLLPAPASTRAGLKLCNVGGTLGVVDSTGAFTPLP